MDLTTLAIAKKFSGNSSSGGSSGNSNIIWFEVTFPEDSEDPGNEEISAPVNIDIETLIPVHADIPWNILWEAYLDDAIIIPYLTFTPTVKLYFNLTTRENNELTFSCNTIINDSFVYYVLTITQDQAILSITEFSNGDGVDY